MSEWRIVHELQTIAPVNWQNLNTEGNPFLSYSFLSNLEKYDCLKLQQWQPMHIVIENKGELLGALPLYLKQDSYGEFVFDWAWADAYQQAGRHYYPKLVSAIPFTPVCGPRLLTHKNYDSKQIEHHLISAATNLMEENQLSSLHILFPKNNEISVLNSHDGLTRLTCQFHWDNRGYRDFQDFISNLTSKKRKQILKERRSIQKENIKIERLCGNDISDIQWQTFYEFYCKTFYQKWGEPRLTLDFFQSLSNELPKQTLLIMASKDSEYIAGAFAMFDHDTLYGRHWGCRHHVPYLHFELCYYQTIEFVIEQGLKRLDAGVQGEHKLARGFHPVAMPSAHWIRETDFRKVIADYLDRETELMNEHIAMLETHMPYKLNES